MGGEVIDARATRLNQAFAAVVALVGVALDRPAVVAAIGVMITLGVALGPRFTPAYRVYFGWLAPRLGPGRMEDVRAPRFAQWMGGLGLLGGAALVWAGWPWPGWGVTVCIAVAAVYAAVADWCLGCFTCRMLARLRGIQQLRKQRFDLAALGLDARDRGLVAFHHPMCSACRDWHPRLVAGALPFVEIDVSQREDLARAHGVALVPTIYEVASDGRVLQQLAP